MNYYHRWKKKKKTSEYSVEFILLRNESEELVGVKNNNLNLALLIILSSVKRRDAFCPQLLCLSLLTIKIKKYASRILSEFYLL